MIEPQLTPELRDRLAAMADTHEPEGQLARVLSATSRTRQRPAWSPWLRRASMGRSPHETQLLRYAVAAALVGLVAALVGATLVGSQPSTRTPPSLQPGLLAVTRSGFLFLADPVTGHEIPLFTSIAGNLSRPVWLPDGRLSVTTEDGEATLIDPATGGLRRLPPSTGYDDMMTWAPEGSTLALVQDDAVRLLDVETDQARELLPAGAGVWSLTWSPDSRSLAATLAGQLAIIDASDGRVTVLEEAAPFGTRDAADRMTSFASSYAEGSWSPDSRSIAFTRWACTTVHCFDPGAIAVIGADGRDVLALTASGENTSTPRWSPDGRWIAFRSGPNHEFPYRDGSGSTWASELWLVRPDGSDGQAIVADAVVDFAWDPGARSITFLRMASADEAEHGLWRVDVDSGDLKELGVIAHAFAWQSVPAGSPPSRLPELAAPNP